MTVNFKGYSLPEKTPRSISIRQGELGGFVVEVYHSEGDDLPGYHRMAGFSTLGQLLQVLPAILVGGEAIAQTAKETEQAVNAPVTGVLPKKRGRPKKVVSETVQTEAPAPKKRGPKPGWKKAKAQAQAEQEVKVEQQESVAEAA